MATEDIPLPTDCRQQEKTPKRRRVRTKRPHKGPPETALNKYFNLKTQEVRIHQLAEKLEALLRIQNQQKHRKPRTHKRTRKTKSKPLPQLRTDLSCNLGPLCDNPFLKTIESLQSIVKSTKSLLTSSKGPMTLELDSPRPSCDIGKDSSIPTEISENTLGYSELVEQFKHLLHSKSQVPAELLMLYDETSPAQESYAETEYFLLDSGAKQIKIPILDLTNVHPSFDSSESESNSEVAKGQNHSSLSGTMSAGGLSKYRSFM